MTRHQARELAYRIVGLMMVSGGAESKYVAQAEDAILSVELDTARRCAEIASRVADSYGEFPSHHAVGAETVGVSIRREFGLTDATEGYGPDTNYGASKPWESSMWEDPALEPFPNTEGTMGEEPK